MQRQLAELIRQAEEASTTATTLIALDAVRVRFLGKKGEITELFLLFGRLSPEERPAVGQLIIRAIEDVQILLEVRRA